MQEATYEQATAALKAGTTQIKIITEKEMATPTLMTSVEFIKFLSGYCKDMQEAESPSERQKEVYQDVDKMIQSYLLDYKAAKRLAKGQEEAMLEAIAIDRRREFDSPESLLAHIWKIASKPPFFDSERISLSAIHGFTSDYLNKKGE